MSYVNEKISKKVVYMSKIIKWNVGDLDPDLLFEVTDSRDPDTSSRFSWPVPNWLNAEGVPTVEHPNIQYLDKKGEYRFIFQNFVDGCDQGVKIDGTGLIMFMTPTHKQSEQIIKILEGFQENIENFTPEMVEEALDQIYRETGLTDRWNSSMSDIDRKYDPVDTNSYPYLGSFVYKPYVSSALYLKGDGVFDGVALTGQRFEKGAFVLFPKMNMEDARAVIELFDPLNPESSGAKIVGLSEFLKTRRLNDGIGSYGSPIRLYALNFQDAPKRKYYKPTPFSGFPDNSHAQEAIESDWLRKIEDIYALYGYGKIKTRAVEDLSVLRLEEGVDVPSRIYAIKPAFTENAEARLGLRFDHTVPLARYIAENKAYIRLPFKSARIGSVWRANDVKRGVYREFTQADIDIVGHEGIASEYDAEFPHIMYKVLEALGVSDIQIGISNRKITEGFFQALGLDDETAKKAIRLIELKHTIGIHGIRSKLYESLSLDKTISDTIIAFSQIKSDDLAFSDLVNELGLNSPLMLQGIEELEKTMRVLSNHSNIVADMSVVRGMDYYTGTVYEGRAIDHPELPPLVMGGRYDDLVGRFMKENLSGVGISLDVTGAIDLMNRRQEWDLTKRTSSQVLITYASESEAQRAEKIAENLRAKGIASEVLYGETSLKRQVKYADKKRIPHVMFFTDDGVEVRDMNSSQQSKVEVKEWSPV